MRIDELRGQAGAPLIFANSDGYITGISQAFREAYGWAAADLVGRPLTTIIPPGFHDAHHLGFARFLTTGEPTILDHPLTLDVVRKDGRVVPAVHRILAERVAGAWTFAASITPVRDTA